jgi:predicted acylesterase/phospholipase RssA
MNRDPRYEMRLALVLNGGVSLAVWMGGVTAEIDRMRRAAYPALPRAESDGPVMERWEHLLDRLGVRLIVDVIAGASAGGLNGAVLAAAIARGQPMPDLHDTWEQVGSIENLASTQGERPGSDRLSILNGDLLTTRIAGVFDTLPNTPEGLPAGAGLREHLAHEATQPRGVTLFTTATSLRGEGEDFSDSTNQRFTQVENRVVCRFRRPLVGADEFNQHFADQRLTRAARASASFPGAFEPVFFQAGETVTGVAPEDVQVRMTATARIASSRWMIDGGVLDNEPFAPVLDRIARRPITHNVDRIVAYIDPEDATAPTGDDVITNTPGMIEAVWSAMNLPRESNLLNQLGRLGELEREIEVDGVSDVKLLKRALRGKLDAAVAALRPIYRKRRKAAVVHEIRLLAQSGKPPDDLAVPSDELGRPDAEGAPAGDWAEGISAAERVLRVALNLARSAAEVPQAGSSVSDALFGISVSLIHLSQLKLEVLGAVVDSIPPESAFALTDAEILDRVDAALTPERRALIAVLVADALRPFVAAGVWPAEAAPAADANIQAWADEQRRLFVEACLKIEVVRRAAAPLSAYHPVPRFRFCRFGANVGTPFWAEGQPISGKLMGLKLQHFGGFLNAGWRNYDWMWGRLDGATHLVRMLLERLRSMTDADVEQIRTDLHEWVGEGYADDLDAALAADRGAGAPSAEIVNEITGLLVRPLHRAILCAELELDPATGEPVLPPPAEADAPDDPDLAREPPPLPEPGDVDRAITGRLHERTTQVHADTISHMAQSDEGRAVIGQLGAAGLRALGDDPHLPLAARLRPVLRFGAHLVLKSSQPGPARTMIRSVYAAAVVALIVVPFFLHRVASGVTLAVLTALCGVALGVLLAGSILILPTGVAHALRVIARVRGGPAQAAAERAADRLP